MLFDGMNTLVLPQALLDTGIDERSKATTLGLLTFVGLLAGMLVQPLAGAVSDRLRPWRGRSFVISLGVAAALGALALFGASRGLLALLAAYLAIQVAASVAQAGQQGYIPDLVPARLRGTAAGLKGFMDLGGALLGFVVLGELLGVGQMWLALMAIAAVLVVTFALTVLLVREPPVADRGHEMPPRVGLGDAFRLDPRRHGAFAQLVAARFLFLLGTYAFGRFLLFFVADRLGLDAQHAAEEAGGLLAGLTLLTLMAALPAGWLSDRLGRVPVMLAGAALSALGALLLIGAGTSLLIFLFGGFLALGSALFASANWALTTELAPPAEAARFMGLANVGTAGAAAAAGLFGPLVDAGNGLVPGAGYVVLLIGSAVTFAASGLVAARLKDIGTGAMPAPLSPKFERA